MSDPIEDIILADPGLEPTAVEPLPFATLTYPHQDIALVSGSHSHLPALAGELGLKYSSLSEAPSRQLCVLSTGEAVRRGSEHILFSGTARGTDRLIFGQDDLVDPHEIDDAVGDHILLRASVGKATIRTDYMGLPSCSCSRTTSMSSSRTGITWSC